MAIDVETGKIPVAVMAEVQGAKTLLQEWSQFRREHAFAARIMTILTWIIVMKICLDIVLEAIMIRDYAMYPHKR